MRKRVALLSGLVVLGTVGLAAGIEAHKNAWDYHSLWKDRRPSRSDEGLKPARVVVGRISAAAFPGCIQKTQSEHGDTVPLILLLFQGEADQPAMVMGEATCAMSGENGDIEAKNISLFFLVYPDDKAVETDEEGGGTPRPPIPSYELAPGDGEAFRFIG